MRRKRNIVHIIPSLSTGGAEKIVLSLYRHCDRRRFNTKILYWANEARLLENLDYEPQDVIRLDGNPILSLRALIRTIRLLKSLEVDLIQTHLMDADLVGFLSAVMLRIPALITIHSYPFPLEVRHRWRYQLMSCFTARFLCVSETVKNHLVSPAGIQVGKISVVYNGIDLGRYTVRGDEERKRQLRESLGIGPGCVIVGNVSRLTSDKGQKDLLMAVPDIVKTHPNAKFLIVGDGELRNELHELSRSLMISDRVIFTGTRSDIPDLLEIMDLFIFPTFMEAFGISVLEAMAMGRPIIATNDAAVPEILANGKEGILIHPGDHRALSGAILSLLGDPERLRDMGNCARKKAQSFSLEKMTARMEDIYAGLFR
jgi:glycosyltransferase involved in cell wall biosynthesis